MIPIMYLNSVDLPLFLSSSLPLVLSSFRQGRLGLFTEGAETSIGDENRNLQPQRLFSTGADDDTGHKPLKSGRRTG